MEKAPKILNLHLSKNVSVLGGGFGGVSKLIYFAKLHWK